MKLVGILKMRYNALFILFEARRIMQIAPIEGFFIITKEDLIFEVKGVVHPEGRVIAYLRYVPTLGQTKRKRKSIQYEKIYDLTRREIFLQENFPKYLWFDKSSDRIYQSVTYRDIKEVLNPIHAREHYQNDATQAPLIIHANKLTNLIISRARVEPTHVGITGSLLAGLATPNSDIDIVVYGEKNGRMVHNALRSDDVLNNELLRYTNDELDKIALQRWGGTGQWKSQRKIEHAKRLQGTFQSCPYFIRLVKYPNEVGWRYADMSFRYIGPTNVICKIIDDSNSIFTPCSYSVVCKSNPEIRQIISYRGRYTEHARVGMMVRANGRLETVCNHRTGSAFQQIVLGEDPRDYLLPIVQ